MRYSTFDKHARFAYAYYNTEVTSIAKLRITGSAGTVDTVITSADIEVSSDVVGQVVVAEAAPDTVSVNISGNSSIEVVANSTNGVEITSGTASVTVSTNLDTFLDYVKVDGNTVHSNRWNEDTETAPATCTTHTEATDEAVVATCTAAGRTEGKHCSVCGEVLVAQQTIPALGHDINYKNLDANNHEVCCTRCNYSEGAESHNFASVDNGVNECTLCGYEYSEPNIPEEDSVENP